MSKVHFQFFHGLGDCSNLAHAIPLYLRRGHEVVVDCTPDKAIIFQAAGATVAPGAGIVHSWDHAPNPGPETTRDPWSGNKGAFNLSRSPMPDIGPMSELWPEYLACRVDISPLIPTEVRQRVLEKIDSWQKPIICLHTKGNTASESKNLSDEQTLILYRELLDQTDGTLVLLDWDNRVPRLNSFRVQHLTDDWSHLDLASLWCLLESSGLFIGIDSGPLHFARFTRVPAIGIWTHHHPCRFYLPRRQTLHVVSQQWHETTKLRRAAYNIVECPSDKQLSGSFIAEQARTMLGPPCYLQRDDSARDALLQHFVAKTKSRNGYLSDVIDRHRSFGLALQHVSRVPSPTVVETGCIRAEEDWGGAGFATYLFAAAMHDMGGTLHSVELSPHNAGFARKWTAEFGSTQIHERHSHEWLREFPGTIDLFYSDSADIGTPGFEESCLTEVQLAVPRLRDGSGRILIDDTCWSRGEWQGKGRLAVPWLIANGWKIEYAGYQALLQQTG